MDKYLTVILIFMVVGIPIAWISPMTGEMRDPPLYVLFYGSIGGIIFILFYGGYKDKKERQKINAKRKRSKK
jgi:membrane associated rhomboid family serine protease|tara:strand:+ start:123 stop:338 length:216 start_codon:yes stop_codon:yes gene_type:complete